MKRQQGFTLIEIMIVVAILGIVAAIAIPSYSAYATKSRRAEAAAMLATIAGEQYRYFSENNAYATKLTLMGYPADTQNTENGLYAITVSAGDGTFYTLTATPVAGGLQAGDAECTTLTLNTIGTKGHTGTGSLQDCW